MANILEAIYQADNYKPNSKTYDLTITLDSDVLINDLNSVMPNNGINYGIVDYVNFIPTESSAVVVCLTYKYYCSFVAERGNINSITGFKEGKWEVVSKVPFLT